MPQLIVSLFNQSTKCTGYELDFMFIMSMIYT